MRSDFIASIAAAAVFIVGCNNDQSSSVAQQKSSVASAQASDQHFDPADENQRFTTAEAVLEALREGNQRFVAGTSKHPHESPQHRASLVNGQHPIATVLSCSDSRVTPVLIFDQGIGDLFVIRVAGSVVDDDVAGSIEYAVDHLGTKVLVVMGHENCGAVTAAYHVFVAHDLEIREPHEVEAILHRIEPALHDLDRTKSVEEQIAEGVEQQVRAGVRQLSAIPDLRQAVTDGRVKIVGAVYSLTTGEVEWLDN